MQSLSPRQRCAMLSLATVLALVHAAAATDLFVEGPAGARVVLDGAVAGELPLRAPLKVPSGTHQLTVEKAGFQSRTEQFEASDYVGSLHLGVQLTPLNTFRSSLVGVAVAGSAQIERKRHILGWTLLATEVVGVGMAVAGEAQFQDDQTAYEEAMARYHTTLNATEFPAARQAATEAYDDMLHDEKVRNTGIAIAAGAVVLGLVDLWLRPDVRSEAHGASDEPAHAATALPPRSGWAERMRFSATRLTGDLEPSLGGAAWWRF